MARNIIIGVSSILQIILVIYVLVAPEYAYILSAIFLAVGMGVALSLLTDINKLPTSRMSWIFIILGFPVIGVVLYAIFGQGHMTKYRYKLLENARFASKFIGQTKVVNNDNNLQAKSMIDYLDNMSYMTSNLHNGGLYETFTHGQLKYKRLLEDIENAKSFIHIEYFIIKEGLLFDQLKEVLIRKASQGVEVRILTDFAGSYRFKNRTIDELRRNGIQFRHFNRPRISVLSKVSNFRDHRKIVVIDGIIAYTGGFNIGDEYIDLNTYYNHWHDFHLRMTNTNAIHDFETFFAQSWMYETNEDLFDEKYYPKIDVIENDTLIYPYTDGPDSPNTFIRDMFFKAIMNAKESIYIATPYLIPDTDIYNALIVQASCGININIITPGLPDKKMVKLATESFYNDLLDVGVNIYEYHGFIHSKKFLIDDNTSIIGTANLDMRSFNLSFEVCTLLVNGPVIDDIKKTFIDEIENSNKITKNDTSKRMTFRRLKELIVRLLAPLF